MKFSAVPTTADVLSARSTTDAESAIRSQLVGGGRLMAREASTRVEAASRWDLASPTLRTDQPEASYSRVLEERRFGVTVAVALRTRHMRTQVGVSGVTRVIAVRPYPPHIRSRVFAVLEDLGLAIARTDVVPTGTPDDEVLARLRRERCDVLLVPFHAHPDRNGQLVHGLGLISKIRRELPVHHGTLIVCPVSNVGLAAAGLMMARHPETDFDGVLFLHEDELEEREVKQLIADFLRPVLGPDAKPRSS